MKVIDFAKKGNVFRLFLGNDDCNDYWGDDWNDRPYEHNAGEVYDRFVAGAVDIAMDYDGAVAEPGDDYTYGGNTPFSKEDFRNEVTPCLVLAAPVIANNFWSDNDYTVFLGNKNTMKIYFNQPYDEKFKADLVVNGCTILNEYLDGFHF